MSIWTSVVDVAATVAANAAPSIATTGAGTLSTQVKIFGFGATALGTEAESAAYNQTPYVATLAVGIGIAAVALIPPVALASATSAVVAATLPLLGGVISQSALTAIVAGVIEVGLGGIAASVAEPAELPPVSTGHLA